MRIIVISDTHGRYSALSSVILSNMRADAFIHLGDGEEEYLRLIDNFPSIAPKFYYVKGNCDYGSQRPEFLTLDIAPGHRILATHGHRFGVNYGKAGILDKAKEHRCNIILHGHTHVRCNTYENGIYILNPGSASRPRDGFPPSYAFIDLLPDGTAIANIIDVR
ncbi:MAG: metallophosphoesterase [Oscillospiraceae bacterium]|nr:metallophosphoesterase [Oscillospiraceae bacterium]